MLRSQKLSTESLSVNLIMWSFDKVAQCEQNISASANGIAQEKIGRGKL